MPPHTRKLVGSDRAARLPIALADPDRPALFVHTGSEAVTRLHLNISRRAALAASRDLGTVKAHRGVEETKVPQPR